MGFQSNEPGETDKSIGEMVMGEVKRTFNPEFINRIDEIIIFDALTDDDLVGITRMLVEQLNLNLKEKGIVISIDDEAAKLFLKIGHINFIATTAPMLGLLGTVYGMMIAFAVMQTLLPEPVIGMDLSASAILPADAGQVLSEIHPLGAYLGENGALDKLQQDNLNAALEMMKQAIQELEEAESFDADLDLTYIKGLLALSAKAVTVRAIAQAEAVATKPGDQRKIQQAKDLMAEGDTLLAGRDYVGAVNHYQQAVRKVDAIR